MATPHVVGVVSLMLSVNPLLTPAQVTTMLRRPRRRSRRAAPARRRCAAPASSTRPRRSPRRKVAAGRRRPARSRRPRRPTWRRSPARRLTLTWGASSSAASYAYCIDTADDGGCDHPVDLAERRHGDVGDRFRPRSRARTTTGRCRRRTRPAPRRGERHLVVDVLDTGGLRRPGRVLEVLAAQRAPRTRSAADAQVGSKSTGATSYEWCLSTADASCTTSWRSTTSLSASTGKLSSRTTYYWQVRARTRSGLPTPTAAPGGPSRRGEPSRSG